MDKKFLHKVIDQLVRETIIYHDHDNERVNVPFSCHTFHSVPYLLQFLSDFLSSPPVFDKHCKDVYGLNENETDYVWVKYVHIIREKINNG
jgi:hypothetical protein